MFVPAANETKNKYSCRCWALFKNRNSFNRFYKWKFNYKYTAQKPYFFKKIIPKDVETDETIEQNKKKVPKKILDEEIY